MFKRVAGLSALLIVAFTVLIYQFVNSPVGESGKEYSVLLREDDTAVDLKQKMRENEVHFNDKIFTALMVFTGTDKQLHAGRYKFNGELTHLQLVDLFKSGKVEFSKVTIPEGLTLKSIIPILNKGVPTDSVRLVELLADSNFFSSFNINAPDFEGYLLPETYNFTTDDLADNVIRTMVNLFKETYSSDFAKKADEMGMTQNEVITLAAMIEAEATAGSEREVISSVFHNRRRLGYKMQCDPTVIFAMGGLDRPLWKRDLDFESPYNTYLYHGLPPGPICSPGLASIKAALYPAETKYLYFVADGAGNHIFSNSLIEHNRAIQKVKANRRKNRN